MARQAPGYRDYHTIVNEIDGGDVSPDLLEKYLEAAVVFGEQRLLAVIGLLLIQAVKGGRSGKA